MSERLFVVLGDVVGSKDIEERAKFKSELDQVLGTVNSQYNDTIRAPFRTLKGIDEFGGALSAIDDLYRVLRTIFLNMYPVQIRFACSFGSVDVGNDEAEISEMDGPAFHQTDQILREVESEGRLFRLDTHGGGSTFLENVERTPFDTLVGNHITLTFMLMNEWTEKEVEIVRRYEDLGTQTAVADELDISQQRVSNVMRATNWNVLRSLEEELNDTLQLSSSQWRSEDGR